MGLVVNRRRFFSRGALAQNFGLVIAILGVGLLYSVLIRPAAEDAEIRARVIAQQNAETDAPPQRSLWTILKNYEQQIAMTLMVWAMIMLAVRLLEVRDEEKVLGLNLISLDPGERILPETALEHFKDVEGRTRQGKGLAESLLPGLLMTALHRFHATSSVQDVSASVHEAAETAGDKLDSDLSLIRYIAWAIPSVGFIGTVRGIGEALAQADRAIQGDIREVTEALGLAFNSTLIALLLSIVLMFFVHLLQSRQEGLVHQIEGYARERMIANMKIPRKEADD